MGNLKSCLNRLLGKFKLLWHSLFIGMKNADVLMTTNQKNNDASGYEIPETGGGGVYKDLLEEKLTQEVEELRYASYHVAKESKKYRYVGNGTAIKKSDSQLKEKHVKIDESDNLNVVMIHDNKIVCEDVYSILKEVDNKKGKKVRSDFSIKVIRDCTPRFYLEDYVKKVVVKDAEDNYVIDFYCSKYPRQFNERKDRAFLTEIKKIKDGLRYSDVIDFQKISWVTSNTWGVDDWLTFSFVDFEYNQIVEFDGHYIIRFGCKADIFGEDLLDKIYCASADEKYEKKVARNGVITLFTSDKDEEYTIPGSFDLDKIKTIDFSIENKDDK